MPAKLDFRTGLEINNSSTSEVFKISPYYSGATLKPLTERQRLDQLRNLEREASSPSPQKLEKLYASRRASIINNATGIEYFVYKWIPIELIESFAIKMDPLHDFRVSINKVAEVNRTRHKTVDFPSVRKRTGGRVGGNWYSPIHYMGITGMYGPPVFVPNPADGSGALSKQPPIWAVSHDTTRASRPLRVDFGEFERIEFHVNSPPRNAYTEFLTKVSANGSNGTIGWSNADYDYNIHFGPTGARLSSGSHLDTITTSVKAYANSLLTEHGPQMLARALPTGRRYSLWRNITELKDLGRSVYSFKQTVSDFAALERSLFSPRERKELLRRSSDSLKDLPNEWLSYWFGWRTLYKDAMDLMKVPEKTAKSINYLIDRDGKPSTFRIKREWSDAESATPLFSYEPSGWITHLTTTGRHKRSTTIRCMINANYRFPDLEIPTLKKDLLLRKLGVYPSISDVYEILPWSWLLDWFTGVGNYLELVEAINQDPSLFNYGFITVLVEGEYVTDAKYRTTAHYSHSHNGVTLYNKDVVTKYNHSSILGYDYQLRKSITSVTGEPSTSDIDSLSGWQKSILGALILQRF